MLLSVKCPYCREKNVINIDQYNPNKNTGIICANCCEVMSLKTDGKNYVTYQTKIKE